MFFPVEHDAIKARMLFGCPIHNSTTIFRKNLIETHQFKYRPEYHYEDYDFWTRLIKVGRFANLREILVFYRAHANQYSKSNIGDYYQIQRNLLNELLPDFSEEDYRFFFEVRNLSVVRPDFLKRYVAMVDELIARNEEMKLYNSQILTKIFYDQLQMIKKKYL